MNVVPNAKTEPTLPLNTAPLEPGAVRLSTRGEAAATVVCATGELDASNIDLLTEYTRRVLSENVEDRPLVLDLSKLSFFGAQGIAALFTLRDECCRAGIEWVVVASHSVERLLRIGDRNHRLPTAKSVSAAVSRLTSPTTARRLLQLVTKPS